MKQFAIIGGIVIVGAVVLSAIYMVLKKREFTLSENTAQDISKTNIDYLDLSELKEWFNENKGAYPDSKMILTLPDDTTLEKMHLKSEFTGKMCLMQAFMGADNKVLKARFIVYQEMSEKTKKYFEESNTIVLK